MDKDKKDIDYYIEQLKKSNINGPCKVLIKDCLLDYLKLVEYKELAHKLLKVFNEDDY